MNTLNEHAVCDNCLQPCEVVYGSFPPDLEPEIAMGVTLGSWLSLCCKDSYTMVAGDIFHENSRD